MARRVLLVALALLLLLPGPVLASDPSGERRDTSARIGNEPFRPGTPYRGNFPDPAVIRVGGTYYAASTTIASLSLPMMSSRDLRTWVPRPAPDAARPGFNESMPTGPAWATTRTSAGGRTFMPTWAPSLLRLAKRRYVVAYAVPHATDGRRCLSAATSTRAWGPYADRSTLPLVCGTRAAIDPQYFRAKDGSLWLLYKWAGTPDRLSVRRMLANGTGWWPGSINHRLLVPRLPWEGHTVENPAMIRFKKRVYLFYSANDYATARYATGYAVCETVVGPCRRRGRLLSTGPVLAGQGGATPFRDKLGRLRLVYHAWRTGHVGEPKSSACATTAAGCPQRRMYVATLAVRKRGKLVVTQRF